jgi:hypothetical protein
VALQTLNRRIPDKEMAKKAAKEGGFKRGFLLSKPKNKTPRRHPASTLNPRPVNVNPTKDECAVNNGGLVQSDNCTGQKENSALLSTSTSNASTALLDLETVDSKSFFRVVDDTKAKTQSPKTNHIFMVDKRENGAIDESHSMGLVEIASSVRQNGSFVSERDKGAEGATSHSKSDNLFSNYLPQSNTHAPDTDAVSDKDSTRFLQCQQDLDRTLWRLRRRKRRKNDTHASNGEDKWRNTALKFSRNLIQTNMDLQLLDFVWETIMQSCPMQSPQCSAELRLGCILLESTETEESWKVFSGFLQPGESKSDRILTLGAVTILDFWCSQAPTDSSKSWMTALLKHVVPVLGQQVTGESTRTVLAQRCMIAIYNLVATVSDCSIGDEVTKNDTLLLIEALWDVSSRVLLPVLDIHMAWTATDSDSKSGDDRNNADLKRIRERKNCTKCVLKNWKVLFLDAIDERDMDQVKYEWCQILQGVLLSERQIRVGSFRQAFSKHQSDWGEGDILAFLGLALDTGQQAKPISDENAATQARHTQLGLIMGVVGWLGHSKKNRLPDDQQQLIYLSSRLIRFALSEAAVHLAAQIL